MMEQAFGVFLVEKGLITPEQFREARRARGMTRQATLSHLLLELGFITEDALELAAAAFRGLEAVDLTRYPIDPAALNIMPPHYAWRHYVLPLEVRAPSWSQRQPLPEISSPTAMWRPRVDCWCGGWSPHSNKLRHRSSHITAVRTPGGRLHRTGLNRIDNGGWLRYTPDGLPGA